MMAPTGTLEKVVNTSLISVLSYKWSISDFYLLWTKCINTQFIYSSYFDIVSDEEIFPCYLQLYPKGDTARYSDYLISKLIFDRQNTNILDTDAIQISVLNDKNSVISQQRIRKPSFTNKTHYSFLLIDVMSLMDPTNRAVISGTLTIQFDVIFNVSAFLQKATIFQPIYNLVGGHNPNSNADFEQLLDNQNFSDVRFIVGDKIIYSHKVILAARSHFFEAMFRHDMKESNDGVVRVEDVKYEVMKELLRFVYAGKVNDIEIVAKELLVAADKYNMDELKNLCEKSLYNSLNVGNAIEYLILTCACKTFYLKWQVIQFVSVNPDIVDQPKFKTLSSDIMYEVIRAVMRKRAT